MKDELIKSLLNDIGYHIDYLQKVNTNAIKLCESNIADKFSEIIFTKKNESREFENSNEYVEKEMIYTAGKITQLKEFQRELKYLQENINDGVRSIINENLV